MATNWTTKKPFKPFEETKNGTVYKCIVVLREYTPASDIEPGPASPNVFNSRDYMVTNQDSVFKEGLTTILDVYGKEYSLEEFDKFWQSENIDGSPTKTGVLYTGPDETPPGRVGKEEIARYGTGIQAETRALLGSFGIAHAKFKAGTSGYDIQGPFYPPRPGVNYVLYKVMVNNDIFNTYQTKAYANRTTKILSRGNNFYKEIEFANFEELSTHIAEVSAVLKEYETEHQKLQTRNKDPKMFFGPIELNVPRFPYSATGVRPQLYGKLDLIEEGEKLDELNFRLKDFFRNNNFDLTSDKIAVGFYATPKNLDPSTSSDQTETADAEVAPSTETAQESTGDTETSETEITLPEITTSQTDPTSYTNKYRVSSGDSLWKITAFYLGAGPRWKQLRELNSSNSKFRKRGWKSDKQIKGLEEQLANTEEVILQSETYDLEGEPPTQSLTYITNPKYEAIHEKLRKAKSPLIHPGDILEIPSVWLDEIASKNSWSSRQKDELTYITFDPALINPPPPAGPTPISDDGPSHVMQAPTEDPGAPGALIDPWEMYDLDSLAATGIGVSNIAYIKRYTKKYEKAVEAYKSSKTNYDISPPNVDKTTLETRLAASKAVLEENIINERIYVWADFLGLVYSDEYHEKYRTTRFLSNLEILIAEPGVKGALTRFCSPSKKPPKKAKKITAFVKKYIYDPPSLRDVELSSDDEALYAAYLAKRTPPFHTPQTEEQKNAWNTIIKSPAMKFAVSNRTQKFSNKVGDAVFAALPRSVNRIDDLDDLHRYVLSRLSIPQMAEELMRCLGLTMSLDDVIEALCDGFLKKIGADPDKIDEFFVKLKSGEFNPTAGGVEFLDTAEMAQDLQRYLSEAVAAGVDDPFYSSVIKQNINNAQGKRLICELVLGAMFALADMLANLETNPNPYDQADDSIPPVPKCSTRFSFPRIPAFGSLLDSILKQIEQKIYDYLNKVITNVAKEIIEAIIEACAEPEPEFGPPLPPVTDEQGLKQAFAPLTGADPRDFLSHLLSILTANELCQLVNGSAGKPLLLQVRKFMKLNYPEYFNQFSTNYKIFSFFKNLQGILDLSACDLPTPEPKFSLDNLCKDGMTPREEALRRTLLAKGLTEEEVQEQLAIDKEIKKDIVSDLVKAMYPEDQANNADQALDINSVIAQSKAMEKGNDLTIGATFKSLQNSMYSEVGAFIPTIFSEINKLEKEGNYTFTNLPIFDTLMQFAYADWANKVTGFSSSDPNVFTLEVPQIKYQPGQTVEEQIAALGPAVTPTTAAGLKDIPGTYSVVLEDTKRIVYDMASYNNPLNDSPKYDDMFFFSVKGKYGKNLFSSERSVDGLEIKDEIVKQKISEYPVDDDSLPRQIDVFNQFLANKVRQVYQSVKSGLSAEGQESIDNSLDNLGDWYGINNIKRDLVPNYSTKWSLGEYIYDTAFISIIDRITRIITTSEYLSLETNSPLQNLDLLGHRLGDLEDVKKETKQRVNSLMGSHDFSTGQPPTFLGNSLFEGAIKTIIKAELIQNLLRTTFVFSKFKISDAFSDAILQEYMISSIKTMKEGEVYDLYRKYILEQERELRNKLTSQGPRSKPPGPVLSDQQIESEVKKQIYADKATNADEYIMSFVQTTSEALKDKIIRVFGNMQKAVDERVDLAEKGLTQNVNKLALQGETSKIMGHVHTYEIDENGNGIASAAYHPDFPEIFHEHTIQNFIVQDAESEYAPGHNHQLQLKDYPSPVINTITALGSDLNSQNWANSTTSNDIIGGSSSTCMQECFWDERKHLAEVPAGTILPPGTNWDASEAIFATLEEPVIKEIGWATTGEYQYKKFGFGIPPVTMVSVDADDARKELHDVVKAGRKYFEDHFEGFYNPVAHTVEDYDSGIWSDLLFGSIGDQPETSWNQQNPFSPYYGVEYYWEASSGPKASAIDKSGASGYKLIAKKTHSYQTRPPRTTSEWSSYSSGQFIQDGVHSTLIGGGTAEGGNFFFGQNVAPTEKLILYDEGREFPLIRLSIPTRGSSDINIHHVTKINLQVSGENLHPNARAMLVGQNFGFSYDVTVNSAPDADQDTGQGEISYANTLDLTIPVVCFAGKHSHDEYGAENNDEWGDNGFHNDTNSERLKGGHGHIDEISGKTVVDDVYVLQILNPDSGQLAAAPVYFHTFKSYGRNWKTNYSSTDNKSWRDHYTAGANTQAGANFFNNYLMPSWNEKEMEWPQGKPETKMPFRIGPKPDEGLNQFFALTTYGDDDQAWDIFDVADVTGIKQDNVQTSEQGYGQRKSVVCAPRLTRKESVEKLRNGGFILEKYIKIKFKAYPEIALKDKDLANRIYAGTAAEGFINDEDSQLGQPAQESIYDKLTVDLDPKKMDKIAALISQNITGFVGQGEIEASEKIEADIFRFAKFDQVPGMVAAATNPQILSYNAFSRLQQALLGLPDEYDPATGAPEGLSEFSTEVSPYLDQFHFTEIVEDFSYGLRVCYVAPFVPFENASTIMLNMFSPNPFGNEYQGLTPINFDSPSGRFVEHLTKAKAQNKLFHLVEYDGYTPGMYKLPPGSIIEGTADIDFAETSYSEGVVDSDINNIKIKGPASQVGGSLLGEFEEDEVIHTKVMKNVFIFPIAKTEISYTDNRFPSSTVKTFQDLLSAYPTENPTELIPLGKEIYDNLYVKLKTSSDFKLAFDYLLPAKRALAMTTIYNMLAFDSVFPDPCKFQNLFALTKNTAFALAEMTIKDPTATSDMKPPYNSDTDIVNLLRQAGGFTNSCPMPAFNPDILNSILGAESANIIGNLFIGQQEIMNTLQQQFEDMQTNMAAIETLKDAPFVIGANIDDEDEE